MNRVPCKGALSRPSADRAAAGDGPLGSGTGAR